MKLYRLVVKFIIILLIIQLTGVNSGCTDPNEHKPPEDSLLAPPAPPQLSFPPMDTEYVLTPNPGYVLIPFDWSDVEGAQYYEIEFSSDPDFGISATHESNSSEFTVTFYKAQEVYWHVRAGSDKWTWFTDWSETWYCRIVVPID